ncbi:MAG: hypothetical protein QM640_11225 [Niabella sp.]
MSLLKAIRRLEYANFLIKKKATGNLETFARKMNLSERSVSDLLEQMREMGASISYNRKQNTYYYEENGEFCISKFMKYGEVLTKDEAAKIGRPEELCFSEKAIFVLCKER